MIFQWIFYFWIHYISHLISRDEFKRNENLILINWFLPHLNIYGTGTGTGTVGIMKEVLKFNSK